MSQGVSFRNPVCSVTCSIFNNNNLVDASSLSYAKETVLDVVGCVYRNVKRLTKPWLAPLQI
jgi:hypothetical protein